MLVTPFRIDRDQRLFYAHLVVRQFFFGIGYLGWVYLVVVGMPILHVVIGVFIFRLLQMLVFGPVSYGLLQRFNAKAMFFLSMVLQAGFLLSFYYAPFHILLFCLTVVLAAFYDSLYYSVKDNLERITVPPEHIAQNVGVARAVMVVSDVAGILFFAYVLRNPAPWIFFFAAGGVLLSYLPAHWIRVRLEMGTKEPFAKRMALGLPLKEFLTRKTLLTLMGFAVVAEFMEFLPIFLAHLRIDLLTIGAVYSLMKLGAAVGSVLAGRYESRSKNDLFYAAGFLTMLLFVFFMFLPPLYLSVFFLLYGILGTVWQVTIVTKVQKFVFAHFGSCAAGGVFFQWIEASYRVLAHPILIALLLTTSARLHVFLFAASCGFILFAMRQNSLHRE